LTEEASSETLVGEALVGDEEVVKAVSLFNIDAVQLIPETFYYNYQELLSDSDADKDKPTNLLLLQYPFSRTLGVQNALLSLSSLFLPL